MIDCNYVLVQAIAHQRNIFFRIFEMAGRNGFKKLYSIICGVTKQPLCVTSLFFFCNLYLKMLHKPFQHINDFWGFIN